MPPLHQHQGVEAGKEQPDRNQGKAGGGAKGIRPARKKHRPERGQKRGGPGPITPCYEAKVRPHDLVRYVPERPKEADGTHSGDGRPEREPAAVAKQQQQQRRTGESHGGVVQEGHDQATGGKDVQRQGRWLVLPAPQPRKAEGNPDASQHHEAVHAHFLRIGDPHPMGGQPQGGERQRPAGEQLPPHPPQQAQNPQAGQKAQGAGGHLPHAEEPAPEGQETVVEGRMHIEQDKALHGDPHRLLQHRQGEPLVVPVGVPGQGALHGQGCRRQNTGDDHRVKSARCPGGIQLRQLHAAPTAIPAPRHRSRCGAVRPGSAPRFRTPACRAEPPPVADECLP